MGVQQEDTRMRIEVAEKCDGDIDMRKKRGVSAVPNHYYDHQVDVELSLSGIKVENQKSRVVSRMLKVENRRIVGLPIMAHGTYTDPPLVHIHLRHLL